MQQRCNGDRVAWARVAEGVEEDACFSCAVGFVFLFCTTVVFIMLDWLVGSFSVLSAHPLSEQSEVYVSENERVAKPVGKCPLGSWMRRERAGRARLA